LVLAEQESDMLKWWGGVVDALPFYVLLVDEDHHIVAWNRAMGQRYAGIEPRGAYCPEVVHGQSHPYDGCPLEVAVQSDGAVEEEIKDRATGRWVASATRSGNSNIGGRIKRA
jgi:hypothetical protein